MLYVELQSSFTGLRFRSMLAFDEKGGMPRANYHIPVSDVEWDNACFSFRSYTQRYDVVCPM